MNVKPSTKKSWKKFDFDEPKQQEPENRRKKPSEDVSITSTRKPFDFESKIAPKTLEDVAVHNKKIAEVKSWLESNVLSNKNKRILLITGPTGSGKTITVTLLCKELNVDIIEWVNPVDKDYGPGQVVQLTEFFEESKYPSLFSVNKYNVRLIEDFPNSVVNKSEEFFKILEKIHRGNLPVIFICTEVSNGNLNLSQKLFPQEIRDLYHIFNINFNSISTTLLKKCLKRASKIIESNTDLRSPNQEIIDSIITSSMGDIRTAIKQFYFTCLNSNSSNFPSKLTKSSNSGTKRKRNQITSPHTNPMMTKDENLGLFHALGRILNPKRVENGNSWRLQANVESLIDELSLQSDTFQGFLYENYLKYFGDLTDVSYASEALSLSDGISGRWSESCGNSKSALWVAVLGVMVTNATRVSKWTQITAPKRIRKEIGNDLHGIRIEDRSYYNRITKTNCYNILN